MAERRGGRAHGRPGRRHRNPGRGREVRDDAAHRRRQPPEHLRAGAHRPAQDLGRAGHRRPDPGGRRRPGRARDRLPLPADHQRRLHRPRHRQDPGAADGPPGGTQGDARQHGRSQAEDRSGLRGQDPGNACRHAHAASGFPGHDGPALADRCVQRAG